PKSALHTSFVGDRSDLERTATHPNPSISESAVRRETLERCPRQLRPRAPRHPRQPYPTLELRPRAPSSSAAHDHCDLAATSTVAALRAVDPRALIPPSARALSSSAAATAVISAATSTIAALRTVDPRPTIPPSARAPTAATSLDEGVSKGALKSTGI
ncbi:hypothetical protein SORBI_3010G119800, partial [Sorghum bicolor]